jgi:hypothetical protein
MGNPYAPPQSDVKDAPEPGGPPPDRVVLAVRLLWASLGLGVPSLLMDWGRSPGAAEAVGSAMTQLVLFGLAAFLNISIHRGRHWARALAVVLTGFEVIALALPIEHPEQAVIEVICIWVAVMLDVTAMILLYTRPASGWFHRASNAPSA